MAKLALEKKFTIVGTMRHDRKGIPKESKSVNDREDKPVLFVYHEEKNVILGSYIDRKKSGKKNVIVFRLCMTRSRSPMINGRNRTYM